MSQVETVLSIRDRVATAKTVEELDKALADERNAEFMSGKTRRRIVRIAASRMETLKSSK